MQSPITLMYNGDHKANPFESKKHSKYGPFEGWYSNGVIQFENWTICPVFKGLGLI